MLTRRSLALLLAAAAALRAASERLRGVLRPAQHPAGTIAISRIALGKTPMLCVLPTNPRMAK